MTGSILFAFAATHLLNHAFGLVSVDAMENIRDWRVAITRSLAGTIVLATALVVHIILGLAKFAQRRTWRMSGAEITQLMFGIAIPLLLFKHIIGMRVAHEMFGVKDNYIHALHVLWPAFAYTQLALISLVWLHGCIGIHHLLRIKAWYQRVLPVMLGAAVLVPVLAYAGFAVAAREVRLIQDWKQPLTDEQYRQLLQLMDNSWWIYVGILGGIAAFHLLVQVRQKFKPTIRITYPGELKVASTEGATLLETSRANNIPHASVCGGRARCSTCRVRILEGHDHQPEPDEREAAVLRRVGATSNVRLACQLRPVADLSVVPLLPAHRIADSSVPKLDKYFWGVEQEVTLLFADIRGFTQLSERNLPYDVVFVLNQYLANMSQAISDAGGYVDKFMGDGIMAIFGMDKPVGQGARDAINAARAMSGVLDALNMSLKSEIGEPFRIGIGIHTGVAILGRIGVVSGTGAGERVTALGDTVNTASRLEAATKEHNVELLVSAQTLVAAGYAAEENELHTIKLRGKTEQVPVIAKQRALQLAAPV